VKAPLGRTPFPSGSEGRSARTGASQTTLQSHRLSCCQPGRAGPGTPPRTAPSTAAQTHPANAQHSPGRHLEQPQPNRAPPHLLALCVVRAQTSRRSEQQPQLIGQELLVADRPCRLFGRLLTTTTRVVLLAVVLSKVAGGPGRQHLSRGSSKHPSWGGRRPGSTGDFPGGSSPSNTLLIRPLQWHRKSTWNSRPRGRLPPIENPTRKTPPGEPSRRPASE
jgi:hypothetical protein